MQSNQVLAKIKALKQGTFQTRDIVALINQPSTTVSKALARLANNQHLIRLAKGVWAIPEKIDALMLPNILTAPFPSYISLQSALYHHGMIEQIPDTIYAVSIGRPKIFNTQLGRISIHHIPANLFTGYTRIGKNTINIATPEKALFDFFYLQPAKTRLFTTLPELEIPPGFNYKLFTKWLTKVKSLQRRAMITKAIERIKHNYS